MDGGAYYVVEIKYEKEKIMFAKERRETYMLGILDLMLSHWSSPPCQMRIPSPSMPKLFKPASSPTPVCSPRQCASPHANPPQIVQKDSRNNTLLGSPCVPVVGRVLLTDQQDSRKSTLPGSLCVPVVHRVSWPLPPHWHMIFSFFLMFNSQA